MNVNRAVINGVYTMRLKMEIGFQERSGQNSNMNFGRNARDIMRKLILIYFQIYANSNHFRMEKKTGRNYTDRFTGCDLIISEILSMSDANYQSEPRENETISQSQSPLTELVYDDDNDTGNQLYQNTEALALIGSLCAESDYKGKHQSGYNPSSKLIHFHGPNEVSQPAQTSFYADKQNEQSEQSNISLLNETSTEKIEEPESDLLNVEYGEGSWWRYFSRTGCIATCLICGLQINRGLRFSTSPLSYHMAYILYINL